MDTLPITMFQITVRFTWIEDIPLVRPPGKLTKNIKNALITIVALIFFLSFMLVDGFNDRVLHAY